jgi:hypothetical protein
MRLRRPTTCVGAMPDSQEQPRIAQTTAFRHPSVPINDKLIGERPAGFVDEIADDEVRQGAIPPPPPSRPAPREPLSVRLRALTERG